MFKYIFTHSCLILTLEWGVKERQKDRKKSKEPAGISSSTPLHSGWLKVKSKKQLF